MQINSIKSNIKSPRVYFGNKPADVAKSQPYSPAQSGKNLNTADKILLGLGVLAAVTVAALIIRKKGKLPKNNSEKNILFSAQDYIESFTKYMTGIEKDYFKTALEKIKIPNYKLADLIKNPEESLLPIKCMFASAKLQINKISYYADIVAFDNVSKSKSNDVAKILALMFDADIISTKYTKGYMKEFVETLGEFSNNALAKYHKSNIPTFLHFDNAFEFLSDLKLEKNSQHKLQFDNLLAENSRNKIIYILDKESSNTLDCGSKHVLEFDEKVNTADLSEDLDEYDFKVGHSMLSKTEKIGQELSIHVQSSPNYFFMLRNLMCNKPVEKIFLVEGKNLELAEDVIKLTASKTGNCFEKIDCANNFGELSNKLPEARAKAEELCNRTGKRTIFYFENLDLSTLNKNSPEYKIFKEFADNAGEKYHLAMMENSKKSDEILNEITNSQNQLFKIELCNENEKMIQELLESMYGKMSQNDFSHIDAEQFKKQFVSLLALERAGDSRATKILPNGILIYGPDDATRITADAIKNSLDVNYVQVEYKKEKGLDNIKDIYSAAENGEELFKQTGQRTIVEIDKMDELLTDWENNLNNLKLIGRFKGIESLSEKFHTTVLLRTSKSLDDFEEASIAPHRFGIQMKAE